jgi:hypothetical protein
MSVQELKALLDKANKEISRLKTYCTCLEEELRLVKGTPPSPPRFLIFLPERLRERMSASARHD